MASPWSSASRTRRWSRNSISVAVVAFAVGVVAWPVTLLVAVPAFIAGTVAVLIALFAGFRSEHLRDLDHLGQ